MARELVDAMKDSVTIARQVLAIDRLRRDNERLLERNLTLYIDCGRLERENAELRAELGRSEDRRYEP